MKFVCEKNALLKEISTAHDIISSKNSLSILSNVLLQIENNVMLIRSTDLKVSFETSIPIQTTTPGSTTVFCDKFLNILRSCPDGEIEFELEVETNKLLIKPLFKKINFQLKTINADNYPEFQSAPDESFFSVPQKEFIEMISQTIFSVSDDETRYFMNGVFFEIIDNKLLMVATDGRRLSLIEKELDVDKSLENGIIIPSKILNLIKKLSSGEGELFLSVTTNHIFVKFDNQLLSSTLIDGQFPNFRRVIPESQTYSVNVDKSELMNALKRVSILAEQKSRRIYLTIQDGAMLLNSEESEIGVAKEEIICEYEGPEIKFALNYLYLFDPVKEIDGDGINIKFTEANKALSIYSVPEKDFFHILMPMQID